jgi:hypothetical protein
MDPVSLATSAVSLLATDFRRRGTSPLGARDPAGKAGGELDERLQVIRSGLAEDRSASLMLERLQHQPDDKGAQEALCSILVEVLKHNSQFRRSLARVVEEASAVGDAAERPGPPAPSKESNLVSDDDKQSSSGSVSRWLPSAHKRRRRRRRRVWVWRPLSSPRSRRADPMAARLERFRTWVAIGLLGSAVLGAVVAWRASVAAADASDLDQYATQQFVQQRHLVAAKAGEVAQDQRLLTQYQARLRAWKLLQENAARVRASDPALAASLAAQARRELAVARSLQSFFYFPVDLGDDSGVVSYDATSALQYLLRTESELVGVDPTTTSRAAEQAHQKTLNLTGIVALFGGSLVFLTLAEVMRSNIRWIFAGTGCLIAAGALALVVVVEFQAS